MGKRKTCSIDIGKKDLMCFYGLFLLADLKCHSLSALSKKKSEGLTLHQRVRTLEVSRRMMMTMKMTYRSDLKKKNKIPTSTEFGNVCSKLMFNEVTLHISKYFCL